MAFKTFIDNYEWTYYGDKGFFVTAVRHYDNSITLTMTRGTDSDGEKSIGDIWVWNNTEELFLETYLPVRPNYGKPEKAQESTILPIASTFLNVIRWHDGSVGFDYDGPYETYDDAVQAWASDPFEAETREPCELIRVIEVPYHG